MSGKRAKAIHKLVYRELSKKGEKHVEENFTSTYRKAKKIYTRMEK